MGAPADNVNARLACVGKDIRVFDGQPKADAIYAFYTTGITDMQEIVLTALPEEESPCRFGACFSFCRGCWRKNFLRSVCHFGKKT